tara:strand:- start:213 stop:536 length:324 start_codon:yes stop_codon:yes gene_type:complete
MTVYGEWQTGHLNNSVSNTLTNIVDLGRDYDFLNVLFPSLTNTQIACQVAAPSDTDTFVTLGDGVNVDWTAGNRASVLLIGGWRFVKLLTTDAQAANRSFKMRGLRY